MVNDKVKRARHLLVAVERRTLRVARIANDNPHPGAMARIAELTKENTADLADLHALSLELVQAHGPGVGVSPDVMAAVIAPKDEPPHEGAQ